MNQLGITASLTIGVAIIIYAYVVWLQPRSYERAAHALRQYVRRQAPMLYKVLLMDLFDKFPELEVTFTRISALLGLLVIGIALYVSIIGPIVIHRGR